jgi:hypothetical protein
MFGASSNASHHHAHGVDPVRCLPEYLEIRAGVDKEPLKPA